MFWVFFSCNSHLLCSLSTQFDRSNSQPEPDAADSTGKGLLDLNRFEYLCPICRRLANVVLPVVDVSIFSKEEPAQEEVKGGDKIREELNKFWHLNNNLEKAVDFFSNQASCWTIVGTGSQKSIWPAEFVLFNGYAVFLRVAAYYVAFSVDGNQRQSSRIASLGQ